MSEAAHQQDIQLILKLRNVLIETESQRIALAAALRSWVKEYGHNFNSGYIHNDPAKSDCKCMKCAADAALADIPAPSTEVKND